MQRKFSHKIKRIVVKVGTSVLANNKFEIDGRRLKNVVEGICDLIKQGLEVILVSSGAVVSGMSILGIKCRPQGLACIQATAACGQLILMRRYSDLFKQKKINCGQILLTWDDFDSRERYLNAKNTILSLLEYKTLPIINENDTVSTEEIKFGDNDRLSALVACMVEADLLIVLSDVDGIYEIKNSKSHIIEQVTELNSSIQNLAKDTLKKQISKGGMRTKLEAAKIVTESGIDCIVANGKIKGILKKLVSGEIIGTHILSKARTIGAKKRWIAFGTKPKGKIYIDDGCKQALLNKGKSLLAPGIIRAEGNFSAGDIVSIIDKDGFELGRGLVHYSQSDLERNRGNKFHNEVIHRNNLVLTQGK
ncbi:MAG: glutamate 5-kinase [Candidatus Omnitrophota bacterium]|nr:glutamate 5-kinase [Candidatus Omnitrophota bacterium]